MKGDLASDIREFKDYVVRHDWDICSNGNHCVSPLFAEEIQQER